MKAQRVRREIKEKVLALDGAAPGPKLFILLFGPVNERFNLFENTFGPAVRVWTDGRSAGHTVFCMRPLGKRAEMRLLAPAPDEVVLQSRGVTFLPPQAWRMGERLWSDAVNVELAEPWDRTGLFEARVRVKSEYARRFRRTYMIAHDGSRFCLVDEVGGR